MSFLRYFLIISVSTFIGYIGGTWHSEYMQDRTWHDRDRADDVPPRC